MIAHELLYQNMVEQFKEVGALVSPAELHGHLCGRHVVGHHIEGVFGFRLIADYVDLPVDALEPITDTLTELVEKKVLVMDQELFDFRLFTSEDEQSLITRLDDLANWSEGFLAGLGSTAGADEAKIMQEENDTLADLVEISKIDSDVEDNDENEALYAELYEYVRLASFNLFDRFRELAEQQEKDTDELN